MLATTAPAPMSAPTFLFAADARGFGALPAVVARMSMDVVAVSASACRSAKATVGIAAGRYRQEAHVKTGRSRMEAAI